MEFARHREAAPFLYRERIEERGEVMLAGALEDPGAATPLGPAERRRGAAQQRGGLEELRDVIEQDVGELEALHVVSSLGSHWLPTSWSSDYWGWSAF